MADKEVLDKIKKFEKFGSILGMERISILMNKLGNPQNRLKYIHVAGTNGKGSVCRYIYEALEENGYKVGLYTSPFLEVFNERIEFDREYISDEDLKACMETVVNKAEEMVSEGFDSPTEFEVITATAFVYFQLKRADFVVLEVGLGGRGDSTNIIEKALVSIITSISFDHTDRLGNTLGEIAYEKAGIIKEGVPVVMNVAQREAQIPIAREAYKKGSVLYDVKKVPFRVMEKTVKGYRIDGNIYGTDYSDVEISMLGEHQAENVFTALTALELLRKAGTIKVERSKLYAGLKMAKQIGRFEFLKVVSGENGEHSIIVDGAHNADGAKALEKTVKELLPNKKILMITGMLADKDTEAILDSFITLSDDFIATEPDNPRKYEAEQLCREIESRGKKCICIKNPVEACEYALKQREKYDVILAAGSLYLIGEIRGTLQEDI